MQVDKMQGSSDDRPRRRSLGVNLALKHRIWFVKGALAEPTEDNFHSSYEESCSDMVIAWLTRKVSATIRRSVCS